MRSSMDVVLKLVSLLSLLSDRDDKDISPEFARCFGSCLAKMPEDLGEDIITRRFSRLFSMLKSTLAEALEVAPPRNSALSEETNVFGIISDTKREPVGPVNQVDFFGFSCLVLMLSSL